MFPDIDLQLILFLLMQIGIAFLLALPLALNRENSRDGAGLRTFPLVSIAACAFMLVGIDVYKGSDAEARVMYGILTGMGFIGGLLPLRDRPSAVAGELPDLPVLGAAQETHLERR